MTKRDRQFRFRVDVHFAIDKSDRVQRQRKRTIRADTLEEAWSKVVAWRDANEVKRGKRSGRLTVLGKIHRVEEDHRLQLSGSTLRVNAD